MPNCTNCSAPLPLNSVSCDYCGSRNDVDLKGIHYYTTHEADTKRLCPRCRISLTSIDLKIEGKFLIERCAECLGLFFDPGELEALLESSVTNVFEINRGWLAILNSTDKTDDRPVSYVKCPACAKLMNRINFGARSGVVVDRCREHGVWLDAGELRRLYEWMKAGGKLLDQDRQEQLRKEALVLEEKGQQLCKQGGTAWNCGLPDPFGNSLKSDPDLFDIVCKAVRFFTKP